MNLVSTGLTKGLAGLQKLGGLILPSLARAGDFASLSPPIKLAIRLLILAVVLVILGVINQVAGIKSIVAPPERIKFVGLIWLPLLFFLVLVFCWLIAWLWGQVGPDRSETSFPDIDRAWNEAVQALDRAGISLNEVPVFLILGRPQGSEGAFFDGAELLLKVRGQPDRDDAPLRVYANREAIFVTCTEASVMGRQAVILGTSEFEAPISNATESLSHFGTFCRVPEHQPDGGRNRRRRGDHGPGSAGRARAGPIALGRTSGVGAPGRGPRRAPIDDLATDIAA